MTDETAIHPLLRMEGHSHPPITVGELFEHLRLMLAQDANKARAIVTYGHLHHRVAGGSVHYRQGLEVLNLAPYNLSSKGGF